MLNTVFSLRAVAGAALVASLMVAGTASAASKSVWSAYHGSALNGVSAASAQHAGPALADLVINAAGIVSFDDQDAPGNTTLTLSAIPGSTVDAISYNLSIATFGESWLSEAAVLFTNSAGDGVVLTAGFDDDNSGTGTYGDSVLLSNFGLSFNVGSDGLLFVQFFETYDDLPGAADATYTAGNITFGSISPVPEPATYGLMALGLLGVAAVARRKQA